MSQLVPAAALHQQVSANEIRQTCAELDVIVSDDGATRGKLGAGKEITHFLKRSAVLQRKTHQAGDYVVQTDQF
jgi:hypothetical protein